jgi:shikimate kinase
LKDNISLIGFMGCGKTTIGRILSEELDYIFLDLDCIIEISEEKKINDIFRDNGERYFRDIESKVIKKIINNKKCVFACGGGVILRKENMSIIKKNSMVVYLKISAEEAVNRLSGSTERPLISGSNSENRIRELLDKRSAIYSEFADIVINNQERSPESTCREIIENYKNTL